MILSIIDMILITRSPKCLESKAEAGPLTVEVASSFRPAVSSRSDGTINFVCFPQILQLVFLQDWYGKDGHRGFKFWQWSLYSWCGRGKSTSLLYLKSTWYIFTLLNSSQVTRVKKKTPFLSSGPFYSRPHLTRNQTQSDSDEEDDGSYSRHPQLRGRGGTQVPMAKRVRVLPVALSRNSTNTNSFLKFSCGKCSLRFAWPDNLEKHIRTAHNSRMSIRPATIRPSASMSKPPEPIVITSSSSEGEDEEEDEEETLSERSKKRKRGLELPRSSFNSTQALSSPPKKIFNFSDVSAVMGLLNGNHWLPLATQTLCKHIWNANNGPFDFFR